MSFTIISEQADFLIINKSAGLIVHGGKGIKEKTLSDYLIERYPEISQVGDDPLRPGIVHRLDKEASGLILIARNNRAFEFFKQQFKNREVKKEYLALACGQIKKESGLIDFPIKRSAKGFKMAAIASPQNTNELEFLQSGKGEYFPSLEKEELDEERSQENGRQESKEESEEKKISNRTAGNLKALSVARQAITEFYVEKKFINFTLLRVKIKTGRTHQIRVHFFAYGHPLLGDNLYYNKKSKIQNKKIKPERIFLIADTLGFKDLNGEWQEFKIELSADLISILEKIK